MPILHAVVLGLVQGLSEFLPISSSGHLLLVPWIFGWDDFESRSVEKAFDVALHVGTGVAVLAYFRHDIGRYVSAGWSTVRGRSLDQPNDGRVAWLLLASSIPAGLVGALLESSIDERLGRPWMIGVSLIGFGLLLAWADRLVGRRRLEAFGARDAWLLGVAQALALNPGTSRSGVTISAGRWAGFDREAAARISFLMSIPVLAGAAAYKLISLVRDGLPDGLAVPMLVGVVTSGVCGWLAISALLRLVRTRSFMPLVVYRIGLGAAVLLVVAAGWR